MRIPEGAPVPLLQRLRNRYPIIERVAEFRPNPGTVAVIAAVAVTATAIYVMFAAPYANKDYYKKQQKMRREGLPNREELAQGLRPWSDPFDRK